MKKLFLTSFAFTTGDVDYKEQRLVVVTQKDISMPQTSEEYNKLLNSNDQFRHIAHIKFDKWFPVNYPESKLIYCIVHPVIDHVDSDKAARIKSINVEKIENLIFDIEVYGFQCEGGLLKNCDPFITLKTELGMSVVERNTGEKTQS